MGCDSREKKRCVSDVSARCTDADFTDHLDGHELELTGHLQLQLLQITIMTNLLLSSKRTTILAAVCVFILTAEMWPLVISGVRSASEHVCVLSRVPISGKQFYQTAGP